MAHRTPPRDSNMTSESTYRASQYRTVTRDLPEVFHEQSANVMTAPCSALKSRLCTSAPPTLNERIATLDLHASPSYLVSSDPFSPPAGTLHYSFRGMSRGANDPSYPRQQQRASLTEPHSATDMMVLIDKMMGQLQLMKDEVASKHDTSRGQTPSHPHHYTEPPPVHYEYPNSQWYAHPPQYTAD